MKTYTQTEQFCHSILGLAVANSKSLANLVMSLASDLGSDSVVDLSTNPCYHYQFSSISKSIKHLRWGLDSDDGEASEALDALESLLLTLKAPYLPKPFARFWLLNTDCTSLLRPHAKCLAGRGFVYRPNEGPSSNAPVGIGHPCSTIGLSARQPLYGGSAPPWNLPLSMRLVPIDQNTNSFTAAQVNQLLDHPDLPIGKELTVNALDSNYASPEYLADTYDQPHLVNVVRLASNRNVWRRLTPEEQQARRQARSSPKGADAVYGERYKLSLAHQWDLPPDQRQQMGLKLVNGRQVIVEIDAWEQMMIRSKRKKSMKDKPFRLLRIRYLDPQTLEPIFKRPLWLGLWGKAQEELTLEEAFWAYRNRFDLEHFFRFGKQRLLLDQFQTPELENQQNWLQIVDLAYWLLWVAKEEAQHQAKKWQQYDPRFQQRKDNQLPPSPSVVQQQLAAIILSFEQEPFRPKVQIKGQGRAKGTTFKKRPPQPIKKKGKKRKKEAA